MDFTQQGHDGRDYDWKEAAVSIVALPESDAHSNLTLWQAVKKWRRLVFYCLGLTFAILMFGYDYSIVGTTSAMPSFQRDFGQQLNGEWILPSLWLGLWTFASPGASIFGALAAGWFQDTRGRRASLALGSLLSAVGVGVSFVSNLPPQINSRRAVFLVGKAIQGGAIGIVMTTTQTYMSEVAPPSLRGPLLALFPIFTLLGQLVGAAVIFSCLNLDRGYVICFGSQWPFSVVPLVMALVMPESPTYLVRKGRSALALKAQKRLDANAVEAEATVGAIERSIERERRSSQPSYLDCWRGIDRRRTCIVVFAGVLPQLFGLTLLGNASYFAQIMGLSARVSVVLLIVGIICGLTANVSSIWLLSRVGRRPLVLVSLLLLTLIWAAMGVAGCWATEASVWYTAASMIVVIIVAGASVWPASYVIGSETSSLHLRSQTQGIGWLVAGLSSALFGLALPYVYNPDQGNLKAKIGFIFAALCALSLVVSWFVIPEMKGRTTSEIDHMFELKLASSDFAGWSRPSRGDQSERGSSQGTVVPVEA
ncbi:hypothetical protein CDD81_4519 [Ophiocordyceps australis]|uniref:Major facilitator superfamily (MFS) profile domain-containing protein n=1 Tax=Ophiocordyceps australis TaxID=1399860 RepID=A0A2C5YBV5_9HYPO|nr:hypothetical protein CDD81_4519 [Ophiocordyceps australis]